MARISLMDKQPELRQLVADLYVAGESNQAIANAINALYPELEVHKDTITDYRRHPAVAPIIQHALEERRARILRKVDSSLESRLEHSDKMDNKTLLEIRKTLGGEKHVIDDRTDNGEGSMTEQLFDLADSDPEAARRIIEAQQRGD